MVFANIDKEVDNFMSYRTPIRQVTLKHVSFIKLKFDKTAKNKKTLIQKESGYLFLKERMLSVYQTKLVMLFLFTTQMNF